MSTRGQVVIPESIRGYRIRVTDILKLLGAGASIVKFLAGNQLPSALQRAMKARGL